MVLKLFILVLLSFSGCSISDSTDKSLGKDYILFGDPLFLNMDTVHYLYGTSAIDGIAVYKSKDMLFWSCPCGVINRLALHKDDVWGKRIFRAPEVHNLRGKFYMYFSAEVHICIAVSNSPSGPFMQEIKKPMIE